MTIPGAAAAQTCRHQPHPVSARTPCTLTPHTGVIETPCTRGQMEGVVLIELWRLLTISLTSDTLYSLLVSPRTQCAGHWLITGVQGVRADTGCWD